MIRRKINFDDEFLRKKGGSHSKKKVHITTERPQSDTRKKTNGEHYCYDSIQNKKQNPKFFVLTANKMVERVLNRSRVRLNVHWSLVTTFQINEYYIRIIFVSTIIKLDIFL